MPVTPARLSPRSPRRMLAAIGLATLVLAQSAVAATAGVSRGSGSEVSATPDPAASTAGLQPTIHWQEAQAHERDRIAFTPGGRVTVGFRPRSTDRWTVGGVASRSLPAGRLDGRRMRSQDPAPDPAVDQPVVDQADVIEADSTIAAAPGSPDRTTQAPVDPGALRREVFGFLPYWQVNSSSLRIQYDKISTIAYFGVGADSKGNLQKRNSDGTITTGWSGWTSSGLTSIINKAHATGTRVVLTVQSFAWNSSGKTRQRALLTSWTARDNLARQIAAAVRDRGADGVNLDFEPLASGVEGQFVALIKQIRQKLDAVSRGYQLTFDTTGHIGNYPIERATSSGADAIFIMGYDYRGCLEQPGRECRAAVTRRLRHPRHGRRIRRAGVPVEAHPRRPVLRSSLVDGHEPRARQEYQRDQERRVDGRDLHQRAAVHDRSWQALRDDRAGGLDRLPTPELHVHLRLREPLPAALLSTTRRRSGRSTTWSTGTGCAAPGSGRSAMTGPAPSSGMRSAPGSSPTASRRPSAAGSVSAPVFSPNGDNRLDTTLVRMSATGLVRWGYLVNAVVGSGLGPNLRSGTVSNRSPAFTWNGRDASGARVRRRRLPSHAVGRGRLGEPLRARVRGHGRQPAGDPRHRRRQRLHHAGRRRSGGHGAVALEHRPGHHRQRRESAMPPGPRSVGGRSALGPAGRRHGTAAMPVVASSPTAGTRSGSTVAIAPAIGRSSIDRSSSTGPSGPWSGRIPRSIPGRASGAVPRSSCDGRPPSRSRSIAAPR